jgi:hypothetical protein
MNANEKIQIYLRSLDPNFEHYSQNF